MGPSSRPASLKPSAACSGRACAAPGRGGSSQQLRASAALIASQLEELDEPVQGPQLRRRLAGVAAERLGGPGASVRLAEAIMALPHDTPAHGPAAR